MANAETNSDLLVSIAVHFSSNDGGPDSVLFIRNIQGVTQNVARSDVPPLVIIEDPPTSCTQIEVHVCAAPLGHMATLPVVLMVAVLLCVWAYDYLFGTSSLGNVATKSLLVLVPTLLWIRHVWQDVSLETSTSIMIPQASPPVEDTATTLDEVAPAPERSPQPTDVDEANGITGEDNTANSASFEPEISVERVRDLLNRFTALRDRFQLLEQNYLTMFRTHLDDREVDATRPVTPHATEDSTIKNVPQLDSGDSSRSTSPAMETPERTESSSASI